MNLTRLYYRRNLYLPLLKPFVRVNHYVGGHGEGRGREYNEDLLELMWQDDRRI
jgi:hypothetical protein